MTTRKGKVTIIIIVSSVHDIYKTQHEFIVQMYTVGSLFGHYRVQLDLEELRVIVVILVHRVLVEKTAPMELLVYR